MRNQLAAAFMALAGPIILVNAAPAPKNVLDPDEIGAPSCDEFTSSSTSPVCLKSENVIKPNLGIEDAEKMATSVEKLCKRNKYAIDESIHPKERWDNLGCDAQVDELSKMWKTRKDGWELWSSRSDSDEVLAKYPASFISWVLDGPENWRCEEWDDSLCNAASLKCEDTLHECGFLIMNSIANIHKFYNKNHEAVTRAYNRMEQDVTVFADTFCPELQQSNALLDMLMILGAITMGYGGTLLSQISKLKRKDPPPRRPDAPEETPAERAERERIWRENQELETKGGELASDVFGVYGAIVASSAINRYGAGMNADLPQEELAKLLETMLGSIYDGFLYGQDQLFNVTFGKSQEQEAEEEPIDRLFNMIRKGKWATAMTDVEWGTPQDDAAKLMWAILMEEAWSMSPQYGGIDPFFVNAGPCGTDHGVDGYEAEAICHNGDAWYFFTAKTQPHGNGIHYNWGLRPVPGWYDLQHQTYGVSLQDVFDSTKPDAAIAGAAIPGAVIPGAAIVNSLPFAGVAVTGENTGIDMDDIGNMNMEDMQAIGGVGTSAFFKNVTRCPDWGEMEANLKRFGFAC